MKGVVTGRWAVAWEGVEFGVGGRAVIDGSVLGSDAVATVAVGMERTRFHPVWISYLQGLDIFLRENSIVSVVP